MMSGFPSYFQWVLLSSAMAAVLTGIILLAKFIFKNKLGPAWHYYLWFLLLLRLVLPYTPESPVSVFNMAAPAVSRIAVPQNPGVTVTGVQDKTEQGEVTKDVPSNQKVQPAGGSAGKAHTPLNAGQLLFMLWLAGALIFVVYIAAVNLKLYRKIHADAQPGDGPLERVWDECRAAMKVRQRIPVVFTNAVNAPSVFGIVRPRLLLPYGLLEKISPDELKYIFYHELAHLKRKDILVHWVTVLLKVVHWFNPVVWYGFYRMHQDCEVACDALALSHIRPEERSGYGYTIINLLKIVSRPRWIPGAAGILADKSQVKRRITMISLFKKQPVGWAVVAVLLFVTVGLIGLTNAIHEKEIKPPVGAAATPTPTADNQNQEKTTPLPTGSVSTESTQEPGGAPTLEQEGTAAYPSTNDSTVVGGYVVDYPPLYPKLEITDGSNPVEWVRGDANYTGDPYVVLGNTNFGADGNVARSLKGTTVRPGTTIKFTAAEVKGLDKPKYEVRLFNRDDMLVEYPTNQNVMTAPEKEGEYIFVLNVDWIKGDNSISYWFKLNVSKE